VKRLLVLLVLLAGGVAAAALTVPTNATVVNGDAISQADLNSQLNAIAGSAYYQCYLNSQEYLSSGGESQVPPVNGAGPGQDASGGHPNLNSEFVASYLDTQVGHQLVEQLADQRHVTVTPAQLADARTNLSDQISSVMSEILQQQQGQDVRYGCSVTGQPLTGNEVLRTLPGWFVDQQVQFVATASAFQEDLAGVGSSDADLQRYFEQHHAEFDTVCFSVADFSSQTAAEAGATSVAGGTPFAQVAAKATQSGTLPCGALADIATEVPSSAKINSLAVGGVSAPVDISGSYYLLELTKRTPSTYATARSSVAAVVQQAGAKATQTALTAAERRASVTIDPRYGAWIPAQAQVFPPLLPSQPDVLNASANVAPVTAAPASASPTGG
jgi:hypothetical protein